MWSWWPLCFVTSLQRAFCRSRGLQRCMRIVLSFCLSWKCYRFSLERTGQTLSTVLIASGHHRLSNSPPSHLPAIPGEPFCHKIWSSQVHVQSCIASETDDELHHVGLVTSLKMMMMMVVEQSTPPSENLHIQRIFGLQDPVCCFGESLISMEYKILLVLQHIEDSQELWMLLSHQVLTQRSRLFVRVEASHMDHVVVCQWGASWLMS